MKKRILITLSALIALVGAIGIAGAVENNNDNTGDGVGKHRHFRRHHLMRQLKQLGISDTQKDQIRGIVRDPRPAVRPLVKQLVQERRTLRDTVQTSPVNEAAIRAQAARVAQVQADLAVQRAHLAERVRSVLTPEQQQKWQQLRAQRDAKINAWLNRPALDDDNSDT